MLRVLLLAGGIAAVVVVWSDVATADDCSSPSDCANTAWTVGGGAAAAAAIAAAAAAAGWIPGDVQAREGHDLSELSPQCIEDLTFLRAEMQELTDRYADSSVAQDGALFEAQKTDLEAELIASRLGFAQRVADAPPGTVEQAGSYGTQADIAGGAIGEYSGRLTRQSSALTDMSSRLRGLAGQMQQAGTSTGAGAAHSVDAARRTLWRESMQIGHQMGRRGLPGVGRTLSTAATEHGIPNTRGMQQGLLRQAAELEELATRQSARATSITRSSLSRLAGNLGNVMGAYSIGSAVMDQTGSLRRQSQLQGVGKLQSMLANKRAEAKRWRAYADEMEQRASRLRSLMSDAARRYNARVQRPDCPAEPMGRPVPPVSSRTPKERFRPPIDPVPARVRRQVPMGRCDDLERRFRQTLETLRRTEAENDRVRREYGRWAQRLADLDATVEAVVRLRNSAAVQHKTASEQEIRARGIAIGITAMALIFPPSTLGVAAAMAVASIFFGMTASQCTPERALSLFLGRSREELVHLRHAQQRVSADVEHMREQLRALHDNEAQFRQDLALIQAQCPDRNLTLPPERGPELWSAPVGRAYGFDEMEELRAWPSR